MTELVKKGDHIGMAEQSWLAVWGGARKIAEHAVDRRLAALAFEQVENCSVAVLAIPRVEVQIEVTHTLNAGGIVHNKQPQRRVPRLETTLRHFREAQTEQLLVDAERHLDDVVERKVLLYTGRRVSLTRQLRSETCPTHPANQAIYCRLTLRSAGVVRLCERDIGTHLNCLVVDAVLGLENLIVIE